MGRVAIVSDLHANWQAWNAVLLDIASLKVQCIICLGDVVGYGPDPVPVLEAAYARVDHFVLGNHDAALCGKMDSGLFHEGAQAALEWTRSRLGRAATRFFSGLPLTLKGPGFRCAHAGFAEPGAFDYIIDACDAQPSWQQVGERLLFVGHSHVPGLFLLGASGTPRRIPPQDFVLEEDKRFLVNVGSVGQPRDGDPRACYCLFDTQEQAVFWRRVPFDLDAFRKAMLAAGLPLTGCEFLKDDPRERRPPLRERLDFSPPRTAGGRVQNTVEVGELVLLKRQAVRWQRLALLLGLLLLVGAGGLGWYHWQLRSRAVSRDARPAVITTGSYGDNLLRLPVLQLGAGQSLPGWYIHLGDRRRQAWRLEVVDGEGVLLLTSADAFPEIRLVSPPVAVREAQRVSAQVMAALDGVTTGGLELVVHLTRRPPESEREVLEGFIARPPTETRAGGWMLARRTERLLAHSEEVQFEVRARFAGQLRLKDPVLILRD